MNYRKIMEEKIGRKLLPTEVVHHIDGNHKNDNIDNLMLFKSNEEHIEHHSMKARKYTEADLEHKPRTTHIWTTIAAERLASLITEKYGRRHGSKRKISISWAYNHALIKLAIEYGLVDLTKLDNIYKQFYKSMR